MQEIRALAKQERENKRNPEQQQKGKEEWNKMCKRLKLKGITWGGKHRV